jgi:DNA-binding Xre family transcriptional regulator
MGECYIHGALCPDSVAELIADSYYDIYIHELVYIRKDGMAGAYDDLNKEERVTFPDPHNIEDFEFRNEFGRRLDKLIWYRNITQRELADMVYMPQAQLSLYITGTHMPRAINIIKLADALNCPISTLMFEFERQHGRYSG